MFRPGGKSIVPTFSNKSTYPIMLEAAGSIAPTSNLTVGVIFLNYIRAPANFNNSTTNTNIATASNTTNLFSGAMTFDSLTDYDISAAGNWIIDDVELYIEMVNVAAAGAWQATITLQLGLSGGSLTISPVGLAAGAGQITGTNVSFPIRKTYPQGLNAGRGGLMYLQINALTNLSAARVRWNISGIATP